MIRRIMSHLEGQPGTRIEGLGGSFSRVVKLRENSHGMRWNTHGETFYLGAVLEDAQGKGTVLAPGTFEAIYVKIRLPGSANDYRIVKISSDLTANTVFGLGVDGNFPQYHDLGPSSVESFLEEGNSVIEIGKPNEHGDVVEEVVIKKWGVFDDSPRSAHPKAMPNPNILTEIPVSGIENAYNLYVTEANK